MSEIVIFIVALVIGYAIGQFTAKREIINKIFNYFKSEGYSDSKAIIKAWQVVEVEKAFQSLKKIKKVKSDKDER